MGVVLESESSESEGDLPKKVEKEGGGAKRCENAALVRSSFCSRCFFVKHKRRFDDDDDEMGISLSLSLSLSLSICAFLYPNAQ